MYKIFLYCALLGIPVFQCAASAPRPISPCTQSIQKKSVFFLKEINRYRARFGIPELYLDDRLVRLAMLRARKLSQASRPSHLDAQGRGPLERLRSSGISRRYVGENFSIHLSEAGVVSQVLAIWSKETKERQNLLSPDYTRLGSGFAMKGNKCVVVAIFTD